MAKLLKNAVRKLFVLTSQAVPLALYRRLLRPPVAVFCYHAVSGEALDHVCHYPYKSEREFEDDIVYLKKHYRILSYAQYRSLTAGQDKPDSPSCLITFDDGFAQCHSVVRPILRKHGASAVFFVTTGLLDNTTLAPEHTASLCLTALARGCSRDLLKKINSAADTTFASSAGVQEFLREFHFAKSNAIAAIAGVLHIDPARYARERAPFLTRGQVRALSAEGFTIGGHGVSHVRLDLVGREEARREITASCREVADMTGQEHVPFAFPHHGLRLDTQLFSEIRRDCSLVDLFFDAGWLWDESTFMRNRIWADSRWGIIRGRSNLPRLLRLSYADYLRRKNTGMKR